MVRLVPILVRYVSCPTLFVNLAKVTDKQVILMIWKNQEAPMTTQVSRTMKKRTQKTSYGNISSDYLVNGKQVILNILDGCFQMLLLLIITLRFF